MQPIEPARSVRPAVAALVTAAAFAAAYGQAPLYYSNQNQYFLHGLAWAGDGLLHEDWLANTADPTPLFSALVAFTVRYLHPAIFHVYHAVILGAYAVAMLGLFDFLVGRQIAARRWPLFAVLLVAVHSAAARWASYRLLGLDYPWYFQAGVAGQYLLGGMLQPSAFGALLVVAMCLFVRGRPFLAGVCIAGVATIHATYLLPGGLLTLGFLVALLQERHTRTALAVGALTLALVLPVAVYSTLSFAPTSPAAFAEAQDILVNLRIPHHARVDLWLDEVAGLQVAGIVLGLALTWRTRLFPLLAVPLLLAAVLTVVQVGTGSQALALLFPWRASALLVPVATTVVLARLVALRALPADGGLFRAVCGVGLVALAVTGLTFGVVGVGFHSAPEDLAVMDFVRATKSPGDVCFVPVRVPDLAATTRGSLSGDYKPLPQKRQDARLLPVDLQRFRLYTEAPLFVDFKSIPYRDVDVIEWRDRLRQAQAVQELIDEDRLSEALAILRDRGVTHLIVPAQQSLSDPGVREVHADDAYRVYHLIPSERP